MDTWKLVRVDEDFRVIALGIPVPRYIGNPLDPPLRSRFQARDVSNLTFKVGPFHFYTTLTTSHCTYVITSNASLEQYLLVLYNSIAL
jgi:hypothetical protein